MHCVSLKLPLVLWEFQHFLLPTFQKTGRFLDTVGTVYHLVIYMQSNKIRGRDSAVGIATRYGLDGPGIESRWGARFSAPVQTGPGAHPASYTMGTGSFPGVKRPGRDVDHPPPSSAEVEGRAELYIYSPSGPSWPVLGRTLALLVMDVGQSILYCAYRFSLALNFKLLVQTRHKTKHQ